jgi:hypothetical protein
MRTGPQNLRNIGGKPIESAVHQDPLWRQIDFHFRCDLNSKDGLVQTGHAPPALV